MKALSIQQPWAWAILHCGKDIENRKWNTKFRGEFLIHAGLKYDKMGEIWIAEHFPDRYDKLFKREDCIMGGIIGKATLTNVVQVSYSDWFFGPYGFVLDNVKTVKFVPCRGMLNFFNPKY